MTRHVRSIRYSLTTALARLAAMLCLATGFAAWGQDVAPRSNFDAGGDSYLQGPMPISGVPTVPGVVPAAAPGYAPNPAGVQPAGYNEPVNQPWSGNVRQAQYQPPPLPGTTTGGISPPPSSNWGLGSSIPAQPAAPLPMGPAPQPPAPANGYPLPGAPVAGQAPPGAVQPGFVQPGAPPAWGPAFTPGQATPSGAPYPFTETPGGPSAYTGLEPPLPGTPTDIEVILRETQTGRFMFGVGVNSNAGLVGNIVVDERNFDYRRIPGSWDEWTSGNAFRGAGQGFRMEAMPGTQVQRYMVSFTEPYLFNTPISLRLSAFYFDRNYYDWNESRYGGKIEYGYRLTPDLSATLALRAENVDIHDPRVTGVPPLDDAVGNHDLFGARFSLTHDTRDNAFTPSSGYYAQASFEQVFGSFDYPQGEIDLRRYFLLNERADGSGRHTLGASFKVGVSGSQTPIFENYFAGGFSTLRGFDFRGASPVLGGVIVGGRFQFLGSVEYMFPITADDMIKGVVFCDYGTVERDLTIHEEDFRVALGAGLRINVPAMGPAPIALDFASPIARADTDNIQIFSFFIGFNR